MPAQTRSQRKRQSAQAARTPQRSSQRRPGAGRVFVPAPAPVDYSLDYAYVRRDLRRIALWSVLLFVGMVAIYFII